MSCALPTGGCGAFVGTNGAGRTTTQRAVLGLVHGHGSVRTEGDAVSGWLTHQRVQDHGAAVVLRGTGVAEGPLLRENLVVGNKLASSGVSRRPTATWLS